MQSPQRLESSRPNPIARMYRDHHEYVSRGLRRLGVDENTTEDMVQETFIVAQRRWDSFEGRSAERTWLFGIAVRVAKDHRRSAQRRQRRELAAPTLRPSHDLEAVVGARQAARELHAEIEALPTAQREVFVLAHFDGLSAPEIARRTHLKLNTVYSRLRLARRRLEPAFSKIRPAVAVA